MPQDNIITAFQFLEEIQHTFIKSQEQSSEGDDRYATRRMVNFFDNTATLHVLKTSETQHLNGSATPLAILDLQSVAKDGELPTFAVNLGAVPFVKTQKLLLLVHDVAALKAESGRIVKLLDKTLTQAEEAIETMKNEAAQAAEAAANAQAAAGNSVENRSSPAQSSEVASPSSTQDSSPAESGSSDDSGSRERISRRARLRSRDTE